jgi:hypothetical protein
MRAAGRPPGSPPSAIGDHGDKRWSYVDAFDTHFGRRGPRVLSRDRVEGLDVHAAVPDLVRVKDSRDARFAQL